VLTDSSFRAEKWPVLISLRLSLTPHTVKRGTWPTVELEVTARWTKLVIEPCI